MSARRRSNGEGSIYQRKDGRWEGSAYFLTASGMQKRKSFYGKTRAEVYAKLTEAKAQAERGIPVSEKVWRLGEYLDYWLANIIQSSKRPTTYVLYEYTVRLYLKPGLGQHRLDNLTVPIIQVFLNRKLAAGDTISKVTMIRDVLLSALTSAMRQELVFRNVAKLVQLPPVQRAEVQPWTIDEATQFLEVAQADSFYPAFVLLLLYGLRRGEVLGLRWSDVDFEGAVLRVRQQVQRVAGILRIGEVKTKAGRRDLPLLSIASRVLASQQEHQRETKKTSNIRQGEELVFSTPTGEPLVPIKFVRRFHRVCADHGIRRIKMHHLRHTTATFLKNLGVPAREAQLILGHSNVSVTQQIYQHSDLTSRREALTRVEKALQGNIDDQVEELGRQGQVESAAVLAVRRQNCRQTLSFVGKLRLILSVGSGDCMSGEIMYSK